MITNKTFVNTVNGFQVSGREACFVPGEYGFNWFTVKLKGGVYYWPQVAEVGYNMPAQGEVTGFGPFPPHIDQDDMTNWSCGVESEFHFPKTK